VGKRVIDVVVAAALLLVVLPFVGLCAIGVALSLRAWPFFVQERVGYNGRPFRLIKLRTLPPSAPRFADKYAISSIEIPWFPRLLRQLHLDELPQLLLVIPGWMSLVGPRPEMATLVHLLPPDVRVSRLAFRPGCTGIWQVSRDADKLIGEAPEYDRFYARHASLRLDLYVLAQTFQVMLTPIRTVTLASVPDWARRGTGERTVRPALPFLLDLTTGGRRAPVSVLEITGDSGPLLEAAS
jgi:lipopolysaccharide/colanic/teichoic acid biosynthesis glycosyltransferase